MTTAHVSQKKKDVVSDFAKLIEQYPVIGVVNMQNLPTKQLQTMRSKLRERETVLIMTKKRLMKIAFSKSKKQHIADLEKHFEGMPALIFTSENPFKLYLELQKTKSRAPAKPGQTAPNNITVTAGPTSFSPGPIIGQLGKYGIKTGVEAGKIVIKEDTVVAKKGDVIDSDLAEILTRLGIEPMEIGLNLTAVYEDGIISTSDVLHIDEDEYKSKICTAYNDSMNLAVYITYTNDETITLLLSKAYSDSKALALSQGILTDETTLEIIQKAQNEALSLSNSLPGDTLSSKETSEPVEKEEPKKEDVKEEKSEEEPKEKEDEDKGDTAAGLGSLFG